MNDWLVFLTSSKVILMAIFFLCAAASVTGLEAIRMRMARVQDDRDGAADSSVMRLVAVAALVFLVLFAGGGSGLFLIGRTFLTMTLTMFGFGGLLVLSPLTLQFRGSLPFAGRDAERRRVAAHDL